MSLRKVALVAAVGGAVGAVVASFLPWLRSGSVVRSGFALARDAWGAGLADVDLGKALVVAWFLSPVTAAGAWTAAALGRFEAAGFLAIATGAVVIIAAISVLASRSGGEVGPYAAVFAGAVACAGGFRLMFGGRRAEG